MFQIMDPDMLVWVELHGIAIKYVKMVQGKESYMQPYADFDIPCTKLKNNKCTIHKTRPDLCKRFECDRERWKNVS